MLNSNIIIFLEQLAIPQEVKSALRRLGSPKQEGTRRAIRKQIIVDNIILRKYFTEGEYLEDINMKMIWHTDQNEDYNFRFSCNSSTKIWTKKSKQPRVFSRKYASIKTMHYVDQKLLSLKKMHEII